MREMLIVDFTSEKVLVQEWHDPQKKGAFIVPQVGDHVIVDRRLMRVLSRSFDYEKSVVEVCVQ